MIPYRVTREIMILEPVISSVYPYLLPFRCNRALFCPFRYTTLWRRMDGHILQPDKWCSFMRLFVSPRTSCGPISTELGMQPHVHVLPVALLQVHYGFLGGACSSPAASPLYFKLGRRIDCLVALTYSSCHPDSRNTNVSRFLIKL